MGGETIGQRFFAVRLALGDGMRKAMPMREFVALVEAQTGRKIHASELSELERGKRADPSVHDATAVASVDPLRRGVQWLITGELPSAPVAIPDPSTAPATDEETPRDPATDEEPPSPRRTAGGRGR